MAPLGLEEGRGVGEGSVEDDAVSEWLEEVGMLVMGQGRHTWGKVGGLEELGQVGVRELGSIVGTVRLQSVQVQSR